MRGTSGSQIQQTDVSNVCITINVDAITSAGADVAELSNEPRGAERWGRGGFGAPSARRPTPGTARVDRQRVERLTRTV